MARPKAEPPSLASEEKPCASDPALASTILFVARYRDHLAAIRKKPDFAATISSIQKAFPQLSSLDTSRIHIHSQIRGFGDAMIEINDELWADLVPHLTKVRITVSAAGPEDTGSEDDPHIEGLPGTDYPGLEPLMVHATDPHGHIQDLHLACPQNSTIRALKDLIAAHNKRLPKNLFLEHEGQIHRNDDKKLQACGFESPAKVVLVTEFQVYLLRHDLPQSAVTISIFNSVSALKLLSYDLCRLHPASQVLSCGGQELPEGREIGRLSQVFPGCYICVNEATSEQSTNYAGIISIKIRGDKAHDNVHSCELPDSSTVLDLKALIATKLRIPISGQELRDSNRGQVLSNDDWPLSRWQVGSGTMIVVKTRTASM